MLDLHRLELLISPPPRSRFLLPRETVRSGCYTCSGGGGWAGMDRFAARLRLEEADILTAAREPRGLALLRSV